MELIGDCQTMLINAISSLKLQPFKMSDKIHLYSLQLTCKEEKIEKENNRVFIEVLFCCCFFYDTSS